MILVLDASVVIKWFFQDDPKEQYAQQALAILQAVASGEVQLVQPPHFMAEVSAVLSREKQQQAQVDMADLLNVEWRVAESDAIYATASELAAALNHHLFDTLYHAVAMHQANAVQVTADVRYFNKAKHLGRIVLLEDLLI
ncbi:MAG: type II toxin-antitoxin system VapC family toxin [Sideroxydans sp.]